MKKLFSLIVIFLITLNLASKSEGVVDSIEKVGKKLLNPADTPQKIFPTAVEEKQSKLAELEKRKAQLEEESKSFSEGITSRLDAIKARLDKVNSGLKKEADDDLLNKELAILNEDYQVIKNTQQSREQLVSIVDEHISALQDYLNDPCLKNYKQELKVAQGATYSLEDLQNITQLIADKEKTLTQLAEQEKNASIEIDNRKRTAVATAEAYKKKLQDPALPKGPVSSVDVGVQQKADLTALEGKLYTDKNERDILRLQEIEHKKSLIKTRIFIERHQLDVLKDALAKLKPAIKVSESDIAYARDELAKKQQQSFIVKESYHQEAESLTKDIKSQEKELDALSSYYGIALGIEIDEWSKKPKDTVQSYKRFLEIANLNDTVLLLQRKKELLDAQIALEDESVRFDSTHINIKNSYYKITAHKFSSEEETKLERKAYDVPRAETKATLSLFKERKNTDQEHLDSQKKALINNKDIRQKLQEKKKTIFKMHEVEYNECLELLNSAEAKIQEQIDILGKIMSMHGDIINVLVSTTKQIEFIISELELTTIWQRSKYAITWDGVQNMALDIETFMSDIRTYLSTITIGDIWQYIQEGCQETKSLAKIIFGMLLLGVFCMLGRILLPRLAEFFIRLSKKYRGLRLTKLFLALLCGFIGKYFFNITLWIILFLWLHYAGATDPYPTILFYLLSIPYLLYIANRYIAYFAAFNEQHDYVFLAKDFQRRFMLVAATSLYGTIVIFFFRAAFLLADYPRSELPTILLAINFIIFQVAFIFLITKEQILSIIPAKTEMWRWILVQVDRFYYLILLIAIAIIVMSNPYVGFGKLVLYILTHLIYTIILVRVALWINSVLRRGLTYVFFSRADEFMRERFAYAKTFYGFFALAILFFFVLIMCIAGSKIWGWPESFAKINQVSDILAWLKTPLLLTQTERPLSLFSLIELVSFAMAGVIIAFIIEHYIIEKIFDALLIEQGVQNTVSSIVRYLVFITTLILGFHSVGLGELVWWLLGALIVGIGWVIKDPLGDFIAYFIILVQRPVKIGDYIKMDEETFGVVRKITPRSVVVRRRNSTTIIVPNSMVISKPLANWNYSRGFTAFDDIIITVAYKEDPQVVKELILKVMDENTFILKTPHPIARLNDFGEIGFVFNVRGFVSSNYTLDLFDIASDVRLALVKRLREKGIELAIPVRLIVSKEGLLAQNVDHTQGTNPSLTDIVD